MGRDWTQIMPSAVSTNHVLSKTEEHQVFQRPVSRGTSSADGTFLPTAR